MGKPKATESAWIRRLQPSVADRRIVCFPHAGGAATAYVPLARALADTADVVALQYPGRQDRRTEACLDDVDSLVAAIVAVLDGDGGLDDRPYAFFGHSMGAIVAFEVALRLAQPPLCLFASGRRAPSTVRDERVHLGGDPSLLQEVRRLGGTPAVLLDDVEVQEMLLPALRGDYRAIETYRWRPGPPLDCPIRALVGDADPLTTAAEAAAWSAHTRAGFTLHTFPGRHFYVVDQVPAVASLIAGVLAG